MALMTRYSQYLSEASQPGAIRELEAALKRVGELLEIDEPEAAEPWAPGKWTRKEVIGHLIDSAGNNLQRFVRAQIPAHLENGVLRLPSYAQDDWVRVQEYDGRSWRDLLSLWIALNRHILHVMERIDPSSLETRCAIGASEPVCLEHVIVDYVGHVHHHLAQILSS